MSSGSRKIVVLGMLTKMPVAGVAWQTLHYLLGFQRLGYDVYYVEAHSRTPSMLMKTEEDDSSLAAADYLGSLLARFGLAGRWAFHALHADGRCYGMTRSELLRLYKTAAVIIFARVARVRFIVAPEKNADRLSIEFKKRSAQTR